MMSELLYASLYPRIAYAAAEGWRVTRDPMVDWWTSTRIGLAGFLASTPAVALFLTGDMVTGGAILATAMVGSTGGLLWRWRRDRLPLEVSPKALVGDIGGCRVVQFRARLGRGRLCSHPSAGVLYTPEGGEPVHLEVLPLKVPMVVGPFTVLAFDREDVMSRPGTLEVAVRVVESGNRPVASGTWQREELTEGSFDGGWVRRGGKMSLDESSWDSVKESA